jgi:hypothetical protein
MKKGRKKSRIYSYLKKREQNTGERDDRIVEISKSEIRYKYDMSSIDGGKKVKLGGVRSLAISTNFKF